jgi:L-idonate 5-dehydrogenase
MRALRITGKLAIGITEEGTPEPQANQIRIKVAFVGICGSDLHYYYEGANGAFVVEEPLIPGHELSAIVDLDPSGEFATGTRITIHPARFGEQLPEIADRPHLWPQGSYLGSASTHPHTQGAMCEYMIVEKSMVRVLPEGISLKTAALCEPLAVGIHAINIAGGVQGKKVLVSGSGPIGLLTAAAAKILGAASVTASDVLDGPLARARAVGAATTIKVTESPLPPEEFDLVLECSGVPRAINAALTAVRRAGIVVQVGMLPARDQPIALAPLVSKEVQLRGTFRFNNEIDAAISMIAEHPELEQVITHTFDLSDAVAGFEMAKNSELSGKVLISL